MEKETEIEALARMVADGFSSMEKSMSEQFEYVNTRFDSLEKVVRHTNERIDTIIMPTLDDHASRIKDLELASV